MRFNTNGLIGLCAMAAMAFVALSRKGAYIPVVILLIVLYGAVLLTASTATESERFASGELPITKAYAKNEAKVWTIALHVTFALIVATFFLGLHYQPFINLGLVPLALLVAYSLVLLILVPTARGVHLDTAMMGALVPVGTLIAVAVFEDWNPLWYPYVALAIYCILLLSRMETKSPWGGRRRSQYRGDGKPTNDRMQLAIYTSLALVSLGLLIDVDGIAKPHWLHGGSLVFQFLIRFLILIGCEIAGLALPHILLTAKENPPSPDAA